MYVRIYIYIERERERDSPDDKSVNARAARRGSGGGPCGMIISALTQTQRTYLIMLIQIVNMNIQDTCQ